MRRAHKYLLAGVTAVALAVGGVVALHGTHTPAPVPSTCHAQHGLPDPACTPGVTNPDVTQSNIHQTICVSGWTATIRPPVSYTNKLKVQGMRDYGLTGSTSAYEEDHLIALEIGGSPTDPRNLWPQPWGGAPLSAHDKDAVENKLKRDVCAGTMTLVAAQDLIRTDWTKGEALP